MAGIFLDLIEELLIKYDGNSSNLGEFLSNYDEANKLVSVKLKPLLFR